MTLSLERARSRRPVTWLTLLGVLLLPVLIGGILLAALYNPTERLDNVRAAIVNNDKPVTINGQTAPLGRQLTAGLVEGSPDVPSNLDWVISNTDDAAAGLADGNYDAVITIPENFSAAATSTAPGKTPEKATIQVQTAPDGRVVDGAITATITQTAASVFGSAVSQQYLTNVLMGFTNLHDQLGQAAGGADQLASGAQQAANGAAQLPSGATALASGAGQLGTGASDLSSGLDKLTTGANDSAAGAGQLADGLTQLSAQFTSTDPKTFGGTVSTTAQYASAAAAATQELAAKYQKQLVENACNPASPVQTPTCAALLTLATDVQSSATNAGYAAGYANGLKNEAVPEAVKGVNQLAGGAQSLQSGLGQLAGGIGQAATGATGLSTGASQLADGASQLADGATQLSTGVNQLATGSSSLAQGLDSAVSQIPTYSQQQADATAKVVANPVSADGIGTNLFGASAIPLLAILALWFGGLGSFIALQAVPRHALSSRRPSVLLALRSLAPAAGIGAAQGLLVAGVAQIAANYDAGTWFAFAGLAVVAGVSFAAVNQALVAVFGGAGRWISTLVGVLAVATGIVSTIPGILASVAAVMPTAPAYTALLAAITPAGGLGAGLAGMIAWAALAFVATTIAVTRRRTANTRALLAASPALA
ncbi:putative membrane protein [Microbacterium sp. AG790]|uniref:YhgE/Pip family protein n=1 Tax=Microbacterium sp. AG790 TaxID=2183995 RepID=UPI000EB3411B|nr:YhgE/Pip family protein [Microbacterium sp. AG790]RKS93154.1 putative membrane protein [Microbacterium sp. AG790]